MNDLLLAFFSGTALGRRYLRSRWRWEIPAVVGFVFIYLICSSLFVWNLWHTLQQGVWTNYWFFSIGFLQATPIGLISLKEMRSRQVARQREARTLTLRRAAIAGESTLAADDL